ncbi:MAG: hypothetical protein JWM85_2451 [Acidimicrobiaceae bacterium]|nr:hypothetical protein [Acidimicrobiaceae bacterium]
MAWLLRESEVLASLEVAQTRLGRLRGLAATDGRVGALLLPASRSAHTLLARAPIDVAYLDAELVVLATSRMAPNRIGIPRRHASAVLEAEAGAFDRWTLRPGDRLEIGE